MPVTSVPASGVNRRDAVSTQTVLQELERLHGSLQPGETFPSRRELMERLGAAEHVVRGALDDLERQGKIIRRVGRGGSIVAEGLGPKALASANGSGGWSGEPEDFEHSVLAIGEPDGGIFDQAMRVLMNQAKSTNLVVNCRFMQHNELEGFRVPSIKNGPRKFVVFRRHFLPLAARIQDAGHRVVFIGTPYSSEMDVEVPSVFGDQDQGGYLSVKHLLDLGHRRLAFHVMGDYPSSRRWEGWQRALREARRAGIEVSDEVLDIRVNVEWRLRHDKVREYFSRPEAPTAVISWNDDFAIELLTLLLRSGIRVPEDVSLLGYDNLRKGAELHPALSTVDGALDTQVQAALRLLNQSRVSPSHQTVVVPILVPRESTSAPGK